MPNRAALVTALLLAAMPTHSPHALGQPASPGPDKLAYGKHLAQECTTCHRADGRGATIPVIVGLAPDFFLTTMNFYKSGARQNPVMNSVAAMLNDEQLDALATYLATLKPPPKPAPNPAPPARKK